MTELSCPSCGGQLEIVYSRLKGRSRKFKGEQQSEDWWRIIHPRFPVCSLRFEDMGAGETQKEAWASALHNISATKIS